MYSKKELSELKTNFWEDFGRYTKYYSKKIHENIKWILYKTKVPGLELKFDVEKKVVRVVLEVNSKNIQNRKDIYNDLLSFKTLINENLNNDLIWDENYILESGKSVSRIFIEMNDISYYNRKNWSEIFKFMATNMYTIQTNISDILLILQEKYGK